MRKRTSAPTQEPRSSPPPSSENNDNQKENTKGKKPSSSSSSSSTPSFSIWTTLYELTSFLLGVFAVSCALSYFVTGDGFLWGYRRPWFTRAEALRVWVNGPELLTDAELAAYGGTDPAKPIYLGLDGQIYDVSAGRHFYGPGGSYHFFAGRDAARAFVTGCFESDLTPDLRGVEEMFIPLEVESSHHEREVKQEERQHPTEAEREARRETKLRREKEGRAAKKKVQAVVDGWAKTFRGETGKPYYWIGTIDRENGWLENLPRRELCEAAKKSRPKSSKSP